MRAHAQNDQCNQVLLPDIEHRNNAHEWSKSVVNIFRSKHIETHEDFTNVFGEAGIPFGDVFIGGKGGGSRETFDEFRDELYKYASEDDYSSSRINEAMSKLSDVVVTAWEKCMTRNGSHFWILQGKDPSSFTLVLSYRGGGVGKVKKIEFDHAVATAKGAVFTDSLFEASGELILAPKEQYMIFRRLTTSPLQIKVEMEDPNIEDFHYDLGATTSDSPVVTAAIENGEINEHADVSATYGGQPINPEWHHQFHAVPLDVGPQVQAAKALTSVHVSGGVVNRDEFRWTLELTNTCGGLCGGFGSGGGGAVAPHYRTTVTLPADSSRWSTWSMDLQGYTSVPGTRGTGVGDSVTVILRNGQGTNWPFRFPISREVEPRSKFIPDLQPGSYQLELILPRVEQGCAGLPEGSPWQEAIYSTSLVIHLVPKIR